MYIIYCKNFHIYRNSEVLHFAQNGYNYSWICFFCFFLQMIFFNIQNLQTFLDEEQQPSDTYLAFCYSSYNSHKCVNHFLICWRIMLEVKNNFLSKVQQCSRESESLYQTTWVDVQQKCRHIIICRHVMNTFDWIKSLTPINFPTLANISVVIRYSQMALQLKSCTFWIGTDFFIQRLVFYTYQFIILKSDKEEHKNI